MGSPLSNPNYSTAEGMTWLNHPIPSIQIDQERIEPSKEFQKHYRMWQTIRDLYEGEAAVKRKGTMYLRKLSAHKTSDYDAYCSRTPFYNAIRRTHLGLMGSLFRKTPEFALPDNFPLDHEDVTLTGQSINEVISTTASELMLVGRYGLLVDLPQERSTNPKPHIATYKAENIYAYRRSMLKGRRRVDRIILLEEVQTNTEYTVNTNQLIRVLRLDEQPDGSLQYSQDVIRFEDGNQISKTNFVPKVRGLPRDYIPFTFVNTRNLQPEMNAPMMQDIAALNLMHYDASALLAHALFYAGMPTYVISGGEGTDPLAEDLGSSQPLTVGPSNVWNLGENEKASILEFTGHGLIFLENSVQDKQSQMQSLGGRLITSQRKQAALSSEAYALMEMSDEANLLDVANQTERAISRTLEFFADLSGFVLPNRPVDTLLVELNKEFIRSDLSARELRAIQSLYERNLIPLDVLYHTLRQVSIIPMEYSIDEFKALLNDPSQMYDDPKLKQPPTPTPPTKSKE